MKYNCLIVDDNLIERDAVRMHLEKIPSLNIVADCANAAEAIIATKQQLIDIIYSDVQMPEMSGFDLSRSFRTPPVFIFITSFPDHAAESFEVDAIDFVVKPPTFERLQKATFKAIEYIELKRIFNNQGVDSAGQSTQSFISKSTDAQDYFFIKETSGFTKLHYADVLYIESMGDFSKIFTVANARHITLLSLKNLESQLPCSLFKRVHKQYIVNLLQIATITSSDIILSNNHPIPISNRYRQDFMEQVVSKKVLHK